MYCRIHLMSSSYYRAAQLHASFLILPRVIPCILPCIHPCIIHSPSHSPSPYSSHPFLSCPSHPFSHPSSHSSSHPSAQSRPSLWHTPPNVHRLQPHTPYPSPSNVHRLRLTLHSERAQASASRLSNAFLVLTKGT